MRVRLRACTPTPSCVLGCLGRNVMVYSEKISIFRDLAWHGSAAAEKHTRTSCLLWLLFLSLAQSNRVLILLCSRFSHIASSRLFASALGC